MYIYISVSPTTPSQILNMIIDLLMLSYRRTSVPGNWLAQSVNTTSLPQGQQDQHFLSLSAGQERQWPLAPAMEFSSDGRAMEKVKPVLTGL
jgi:hypothetical protein